MFLLAANICLAQDSTVDNQYAVVTERLTSAALAEDRLITIQLPKSYSQTTDRHYPVIYRLDGAANITPINLVLESLQSQGAAPEVIIVAIDNTDRLRDLYPNVNNDPNGPLGLGGGAAKFLSFITTELMPFIDDKYRVHDYRVIAGASAAGVFSLYALQQKPELFDAALTYSAAVWWAYGATGKSTVEFLKNSKNLNHYLYTAIGNEAAPMRTYYDEMISGIAEQQATGLRWINDAYDDVPHNLVTNAAIFRAYHKLFYFEFMALGDYDGSLGSINSYYDRVSNQRGVKIAAPEWVIRNLGYHYVTKKDFNQAIKLFKEAVKRYPETPDAYNGLAYGYEQSGQFRNALIQVNKALALASEDAPAYSVYLSRQQRMLAKLGELTAVN